MSNEDRFTIKDDLGEHEVRIAPPASAGQKISIVTLAESNWIYALSAALGASWRGPGRPKTKIATYKYDFAKYGQAVFDELHARNCGLDEFFDAANAAFMACTEGIVDMEEVNALADFTEEREDLTGV